MYSRVTLLEIDTERTSVDASVALFRDQVLPGLRELDGFAGAIVLANPEGKGVILTLWATDEAGQAAAEFATSALTEHVALFRSPPGREQYQVALADIPIALTA